MKRFAITAAVMAAPLLAGAQSLKVDVTQGLPSLVNFLNGVGSALITLITLLATIYFFWGVASYVLQADNDEKRKAGVKRMVGGIVGLAVMASVWGLVRFLTSTFGTGNSQSLPQISVPQV